MEVPSAISASSRGCDAGNFEDIERGSSRWRRAGAVAGGRDRRAAVVPRRIGSRAAAARQHAARVWDIYVVAWLKDVAVGCGAIRELDPSRAEIQRMYVHRVYRRRHFGRAILQHLENEARRLGYSRLLLETGDRQSPAMALYEASGFHRTPPFGRHVDDPTSVCYERCLQGCMQGVPDA